MRQKTDIWPFIASRLANGENVMLLVVAESSGSSPGRAGYKMAVSADGEMMGSIGGGVMEVNLVERAKSQISNFKSEIGSNLVDQSHRKNSPHPSGMICSGRQTVILRQLSADDLGTVEALIAGATEGSSAGFEISNLRFQIVEATADISPIYFSKSSESEFMYQERIGLRSELFIVGGGHCSLALSEMMSRLGFRVSVFDDRPEINTLNANTFADEITIIEDYSSIADAIPSGEHVYVAVMTIGYQFDAVVIRQLLDREFKYLGVLGSKAKMAVLLKTLENEGFDPERLARIHTPIGLPINSHTPEEIAVSIAAEIIAVKNS